ncbi:hypothetical protein PT974_02420 [Cladobotryum mycophilum]|uniref:Uncharacterized protein n=1 Tax=Cladobotryum mycophilum TaxID=491253 RepID=A0ABR0SY51_9HYPO
MEQPSKSVGSTSEQHNRLSKSLVDQFESIDKKDIVNAVPRTEDRQKGQRKCMLFKPQMMLNVLSTGRPSAKGSDTGTPAAAAVAVAVSPNISRANSAVLTSNDLIISRLESQIAPVNGDRMGAIRLALYVGQSLIGMGVFVFMWH